MSAYHISEIFLSIQGEGIYVGEPAVFVRFAGCNLRCPFCDERTVQQMITPYTADEICHEIRHLTHDHLYPVILTGGEPLQHVDVALLEFLVLHVGRELRVETNGTDPVDVHLVAWFAENRHVVDITVAPKGAALNTPLLALARCLKVLVDEEGPLVRDLDALVAGVSWETALVLQPVTPHLTVGNVRTIDEAQRRANAHRAVLLAHERQALGERWRVIPQIHKWIGVR